MDHNVVTYFYRFQFQSRGTLHLHMLVWVKGLTLIRSNLLTGSIPWGHSDAFLVADTQESSLSCLQLFSWPDSFEDKLDGTSTLRFHYGEEESQINLRAYVLTLLGALRCCTDAQVPDGRGMLLKYVSSYVTKMHKSQPSRASIVQMCQGFRRPARSYIP